MRYFKNHPCISFISKMKFLTALSLVLSLCSYSKSETLKALIYEKYRQRLSVAPIIRTHINENGETVTFAIPPPLYVERQVLTDSVGVNMLDEFENTPEGVFNHPKLKHYVLSRAVREYDTDLMSRKIINHCLEYGSHFGYIRMILAAAARQNLVSLIDKLVDMYDVSMIDDEYDPYDIDETSFTRAIVSSGNFHIAKDLIRKGYPLDKAEVWMERICIVSNFHNLDAVIDFLDFMIATMEMFDLNSQFISGMPALHYLLSVRSNCNQEFQYRTDVAHHLIRLGADPYIEDRYGRTAIQYAQQRGIDLELYEA